MRDASPVVRVTPIRTEIIMLATRTREALSKKGQMIREDTSVVQKRIGVPENSVNHFTEKGCEVMIMAPACPDCHVQWAESTLSRQTDPWSPAKSTLSSL